MASRQLLPRLLRRATGSVVTSSIAAPHAAHTIAPGNHMLRPSLLSRYAWASSASSSIPSGSRNLSSCSVFPRSASLLVPRICGEVRAATRDGGIASAGLHHVQQKRTMATKLKKTKIKAYSSYKKRFRAMANGEYKRWRSGKRHNAHSKTNKQKRQLRRPSIAPLALAKVMKKLNFLG